MQPGDELREHVSDGRHPRQRGNLPYHWGEGACQRGRQERAQPHVQLWHVQLLRTVRVPGSRKCKATENWKDHSFTQVGLPAKSGVSGIVLVVVPNVVGFATWSPPLDTIGNSARGVMFAEELVKIYNFHTFDSVNSYILVYIIPYIPFPDWRAHQRQEEPESAKLRGAKSEACPALVRCIPGITFDTSHTQMSL